MKIQNVFKKDIFRSINGVVKADQRDVDTVWQELDEFVVTQELDSHLRSFFGTYIDSINKRTDPSNVGKVGVWVSGFFGSGKSHFLKILSYLLENKEHSINSQKKRAIEFFEGKISDAMLFADIKLAVQADTDVILFNIDAKAVAGAGREAILSVFLKVLNEKQGFCGDYPHIAHLERYLTKEKKLDTFHQNYKISSGNEWLSDRDAWEFHRDEVVVALSKTIGQSTQSCEKWVESAESSFALNIESFSKWVKEYIDSKGPNHRLIFLVDEIGQFIGADTQLMLNLQTIVEQLGVDCSGRAWVVVTSQEDIDAILKDMKKSQSNDFSKIQGRFKTRLSLSSKNVDEVIKKRLLEKAPEAIGELKQLYTEKGDILKNQLTFQEIGTTYKQFQDANDFIEIYPFVPYQFRLLQQIFESIRKAGATGLHLAQGERSLIDAFQLAAQAVSSSDLKLLVPLYLFYPSVEGFLDGSVKRTISLAKDNPSLEPFDNELLQVLFLIRYVDKIKANVNNLVTLCIDEIDADRLSLKKKIEESLIRLEKNTLISRSGSNYYFLTNEEQDINREIKNIEISSGEDSKLVGEIIFGDIYKNETKHRLVKNKSIIEYSRLCDKRPVTTRSENDIEVSVITPLMDYYEEYGTDSKAIGDTGGNHQQLLILIKDTENFGLDVRTYLKIEKYRSTKDDGTLPSSTKKILSDLSNDNRSRRERLTSQLGQMLLEANYYAVGSKLKVKGSNPRDILTDAIEYLVTNSFTKMTYLEHLLENPIREVQEILRVDDSAHQTEMMEKPEANPKAIDDISGHISLSASLSKQIVLHDLVERYQARPYGWPDMEIILILARLYSAGKIQFLMSNDTISRDRVFDLITSHNKRKSISVSIKTSARPEDLIRARELGREVFSKIGPENSDALVEFLRTHLDGAKTNLERFKAYLETKNYPGEQEVTEGLSLLRTLIGNKDNISFIEIFNSKKNELLDFRDDYQDLETFFTNQRTTWDKLKTSYSSFDLNRLQLENNVEAKAALIKMEEILNHKTPYALLKEVDGLIAKVNLHNSKLLIDAKNQAVEAVKSQLNLIEKDLSNIQADELLKNNCVQPLNNLVAKAGKEISIAHLVDLGNQAQSLKDQAIAQIMEFATKASKVSEKPLAMKTSRIVRPSQLVSKNYLETKEDVDGFIGKLKTQLEDALNKNERIEIR